MKITELILKNFGKFTNKQILLSDGINIIYGENESGKTTLHTFLKGMLFGMERKRGRAAATDTFRTYEPWENPNFYAGILRFTCGGRKFLLERNFDRYAKGGSLICEDDGEELSLEHGDLEILLGGMTESDYENTVSVGQLRVQTGEILAAELKNYAANYYATGNSEIDLEGALALLKERKKELEKEEREKKAMECMQQVGLKGYENQMVGQLSGGMQQRVGLARALANNPEVLLMDEAFSALDPLIRVQMQDELLTLQSKMKKTIVFITHDLNEAIKLGDRIAIMKDGEIVQTGTSEEILTEPANAYVERFVENVDRSKIITASSIMADKPLVARLKKEGPEVLIRKMRERNLTVLPVVDVGNILIGEVRLNDLLKLRKEQIRSIDTVVRHEVHSVLSDTILEDILPLMTRTNSPIWVVNENREFQGVVPLSSLIIEVTGKNKEEINEIIQNAIEL